jgi:hypothetical protein
VKVGRFDHSLLTGGDGVSPRIHLVGQRDGHSFVQFRGMGPIQAAIFVDTFCIAVFEEIGDTGPTPFCHVLQEHLPYARLWGINRLYPEGASARTTALKMVVCVKML